MIHPDLPTVPGPAAPAGGLSSLPAVAKVALIGLATVIVVGGAIGIYVVNLPHLQVVQRSRSITGPGQFTVFATCEKGETALSGGYGTSAGGAFTIGSSDLITGGGGWRVSGEVNSGTLTAYVLCLNAIVDTTVGPVDQAYSFHGRLGDTMNPADLSAFKPFQLAREKPTAAVACPAGYTPTGTGFHKDPIDQINDVAFAKYDLYNPFMPLIRNAPISVDPKNAYWEVDLNNGATVQYDPNYNHNYTSAHDTVHHTYINNDGFVQNGDENVQATVHAICVKGLRNVTVKTSTLAIAKGASATISTGCPTGMLLVGGGFSFDTAKLTTDYDYGNATLFDQDGQLYASQNGPALPLPSGSEAKAWYGTLVNGIRGQYFANSVWRSQQTINDTTQTDYWMGPSPTEAGSTGYPFFAIPSTADGSVYALCARSDATPSNTTPVATPTLPPSLTFEPIRSGDATPIVTVTPMPTVSATSTATPLPPTATPLPQSTATATPVVQPPILSVHMPPNGNFEYCANGQWPNAITVTNTGGSPLHWNASPPSGYQLAPASGTLAPNASVQITISGPSYLSGNTFTVIFGSNGGQQSLQIPCQ